MTASTPRASPKRHRPRCPRSITLGERATSLSIENLIVTGTGLFNLTGDDLNNILTGNASVNTLTGNDGNDILDGGLGNDILDGGDGNDTYILNGADIISFDTAGNDTVKSALTYSIAARADLDNITLLGAAAINATGNAGVNILTGNAAANILNGGGGADTMIGGGGNDTYVVDSTLVRHRDTGRGCRRHRHRAILRGELHPGCISSRTSRSPAPAPTSTARATYNILLGNRRQRTGSAGATTHSWQCGNDRLGHGCRHDDRRGGQRHLRRGHRRSTKSSRRSPAWPGAPTRWSPRSAYTLGLNVENLTLTGERPTSTPPATRWPTPSPATTATTSCSDGGRRHVVGGEATTRSMAAWADTMAGALATTPTCSTTRAM